MTLWRSLSVVLMALLQKTPVITSGSVSFVSAAAAAGLQQTLHLSSLQGVMMTHGLLAFPAPPVCPDELTDGTHVLKD